MHDDDLTRPVGPRSDDLDRWLADEGVDASVAALLRRLPEVLATPPEPATAARHVAAAASAAGEVRRPWRRRVAQVLGYTTTKIAVGVGVAAAATGGLAATDSLPDPVQRFVSNGASYIGIDLPHPELSYTDFPYSRDRSDHIDTPGGEQSGRVAEPPPDSSGVDDPPPIDGTPADGDSPPGRTKDDGPPEETPGNGSPPDHAHPDDDESPARGPDRSDPPADPPNGPPVRQR